MVNYINPDIQRTLEEVFPTVPLEPAGMAVTTVDGMALALVGHFLEHASPEQKDREEEEEQVVSAMTAAMSSLSSRISYQLQGKPNEWSCIETDKGVLYFCEAGEKLAQASGFKRQGVEELQGLYAVMIDWSNAIPQSALFERWQDLQLSISPLLKLLNNGK